MGFDVRNFIPSRNLETLKRAGLHKIAGAMRGLDELTIKDAVAAIGERAFIKRADARRIADGIDALAELHGEKAANAASVMSPLLSKALMPAALGAGAAALPSLLHDQPIDWSSVALGGMAGGVGGAGLGLSKALQRDPALAQQLAASMARPQ